MFAAPLSSTARPAPTAALLCRMVTVEVTASPKRHCCFLERQGRAGVFLLPEGVGAECLGPFLLKPLSHCFLALSGHQLEDRAWASCLAS